jgi:hypothetical protein
VRKNAPVDVISQVYTQLFCCQPARLARFVPVRALNHGDQMN